MYAQTIAKLVSELELDPFIFLEDLKSLLSDVFL